MKTTIILTVALCPILSLTSCETVNGMGKDMQKAGEGIENAVGGNKKSTTSTTSTSSSVPTTSSTPPE